MYNSVATAYVYSGREWASSKEKELKSRVKALGQEGVTPTVAVILIGDDPASQMYVGFKSKAAERIGVTLHLNKLENPTLNEVLQLIKVFNKRDDIHGIMVQLPLPKQLKDQGAEKKILSSISPEKDVDGLHKNIPYLPATVRAILYTIEDAQRLGFANQDLTKNVFVIVGATGAMGSRLVKALKKKGVRIIGCDDKTKNLARETLKGEIVISVTGKNDLITKDMVKPKAVVIDVGAPKGDVCHEVREVASFITPVPGGIGPMTVTCLLENTVLAAEKKLK